MTQVQILFATGVLRGLDFPDQIRGSPNLATRAWQELWDATLTSGRPPECAQTQKCSGTSQNHATRKAEPVSHLPHWRLTGMAELIHRIDVLPPPCVLTLDNVVSLLHATGRILSERRGCFTNCQKKLSTYA